MCTKFSSGQQRSGNLCITFHADVYNDDDVADQFGGGSPSARQATYHQLNPNQTQITNLKVLSVLHQSNTIPNTLKSHIYHTYYGMSSVVVASQGIIIIVSRMSKMTTKINPLNVSASSISPPNLFRTTKKYILPACR